MTRQTNRSLFGMILGATLLSALVLLNPAAAQTQAEGAPQNEAQSQAGNLLDSIHRFRVRNFVALNKYYNYTTDPDEELAADILDEVARSAELMRQIDQRAGASLTGSEVSDLQDAFASFDEQMQTNIDDMRSSGYPDLRLLSQMANQAQALNTLSDEIYSQVAAQDQTPTDGSVELARKASVTMAVMVTRYSARSSSSVAQTFQGAETDQSLDELANQFETYLEELRSKSGNEGRMNSLLSDINSKWQFIRDSYINYDGENVSFVINRYSNGIMQSLEESIDHLKAA